VLAASDDFLIVRTSWVFGNGRNFIAAVLDQAAARRAGTATGPLRVVGDQTGRPTYAVDLAEAIVRLVSVDARGVVHVANRGITTWWDIARHALDESASRTSRSTGSGRPTSRPTRCAPRGRCSIPRVPRRSA